MNSRSVSAANEVKLTKAERDAIARAWVDQSTLSDWCAEVAAILGARLSAREPDDGGFWDRLGVDDGLMPVHLPMGVNEAGEGPENDSDAHHFVCWCGDQNCPLTKALNLAAAVPVSGVPTEAVRELAEVWEQVHREEDDALDDLGLYHVAYRECAADLAALVQRAAEEES